MVTYFKVKVSYKVINTEKKVKEKNKVNYLQQESLYIDIPGSCGHRTAVIKSKND